MDPELRRYRTEDLPAITRMWREIGWIDDSDRKAEAVSRVLDVGHALVALVDGEAEAMVHSTPGAIRYDEQDLSLAAVTAVTTSPIGRNLALATTLTGRLVSDAALGGAAVAALGMFEQGFYDRLGFGTMGYVHELAFDPSQLRVPIPRRRPVRVSRDDWVEVAELLARRFRTHGGVCLDPPELALGELAMTDDPYLGLGLRGDDGRLTALVVGTNADENGPYKVTLTAYETYDDLVDVMGLLRSLSAQIHRVVLAEPPGIQLQDLLDRPIRGNDVLQVEPGGRVHHTATGWYQLRILDLEACVAARSWPGAEVAFDLDLTDPLSQRDVPWPGLSGPYTLTIGKTSSVQPGHRGGLPKLSASIGALSRLWFGVRPATGLAVTDHLSGPADLLAALDRALLLPSPVPGLPF